MSDKPSIFALKEWRIKNGYTTEDWEMYEKTVMKWLAVSVVVWFILGIAFSYAFLR